MSSDAAMSPFRPYLLRAFYEWLVANGLTPHLVVNADLPGVRVPRQYVKDGQIVLNVAPAAVGQLQLGDADVSFSARFGGNPFAVRVPIGAVAAIYAKENGAGTAFAAESGLLEAEVEPASADERPTLAAVEAPLLALSRHLEDILDDEAAAYWKDGKRKLVTPAFWGAHDWHPMSYNPNTGLVYIPAHIMSAYYEHIPEAPTRNPFKSMYQLGLRTGMMPEGPDGLLEMAKTWSGETAKFGLLQQLV